MLVETQVPKQVRPFTARRKMTDLRNPVLGISQHHRAFWEIVQRSMQMRSFRREHCAESNDLEGDASYQVRVFPDEP
jgi:hypothetical protein